MKNIAVFASGSGSDMQSVIDGTLSGLIDGKVVCVVTNKEGIFALERAKKHGIDCKTFLVKDYDDNAARDRAISQYLKAYSVDLIVLAGYLAIVTPTLVDEYEGRIINIHPSLIPKHCGKGMYGLNVHKSVLASGDTVSGCTVHFVDYGADTGKIIAREEVEVKSGDTPESLQKRILEAEHKLLPRVVAKLCKEI